jgi:signal transduction histidine kinase
MDRLPMELGTLGFQACITLLLALVYVGLWRQQRRPYFLTWASAWALYAVRLGLISCFLVSRREGWLLAHQIATGFTALLLLWAALQFSRGTRWRRRYLVYAAAVVAWSWFATGVIHNMIVGGTTSVVLLAGVTLWTGVVFWRHRSRVQSTGATVLAWTFTLWGLHHLDYPLLRPLGSGVVFGVFADVLFIVAAAVGTLFLVLGDGRRALEARSAQLEQLTRLLLRAQEDERRRIARELHDEAGQVLTAVKIQLDLDGRVEAGAMVGRALAQVRDLSNLLRPSVLDTLGLLPALRDLVDDFARRTRIEATLECESALTDFPPEVEVALYRVVQEGLTNVARHARARSVRVHVETAEGRLRVVVADDGLGLAGEPTPHLGLLGMRERVTALGGRLEISAAPGHGFRLDATIPTGVAA